MNIKRKIEEIKDDLIRIRRYIHQHPELGFKEYNTTRFIKEELIKSGIRIKDIGTKTGVLAIIEGEKKGKNHVTALRGDIDALPIQEKTGLEYASQNEGVMHACGHDGHTAMLLGAAKLLNTMKGQFSGIVKLIFQPAEETLGGAKYMVEAGVLKDPDVDNILTIHAWPDIEVGKIGVWSGPYMAAADKFTVRVKGFGGHGAYPHKSLDTVLAASTAVVQFQNIVSRQIDALEKLVISVCTFNGGIAFNVIPEETIFSGTVRCHNNNLRLEVKEKIDTIMQGIAKSFGIKYQLDYEWGVPPVINDPDVINAVSKSAIKVLGKGKVEKLKKPAMGSEDFSIYLEKVPKGAFIRLGITKPGGKSLVLHNNQFDFNDNAILIGVAILIQYILDQNN